MPEAIDPYVTGSVVAASLAPQARNHCDPWLRGLLTGPQFFVKQADGRWRPAGCQLGAACCFDFADLLDPKSRPVH